MAVEKGKVKAALDAKFKGKSVSKELKDSLAARWADKIEDEAGIDAYINEREDDILDAAKEADRRATAAAEKAKKEAADAVTGGKKDEPATDPIPDGAPDWFKAWMSKDAEEKKALADKLSAFEQQKSAESIADRFKKDERLKDVPELFYKGRIPKTDEEFEAVVTEVADDYKAFADTHKLSKLGKDTPPGAASGGAGAQKVSDEQVGRLLDTMGV